MAVANLGKLLCCVARPFVASLGFFPVESCSVCAKYWKDITKMKTSHRALTVAHTFYVDVIN